MNNTLLGRLILGPGINIIRFYTNDIRLMLGGDKKVQKAWFIQIIAAIPVLYWVVNVCDISFVFYLLLVAYPGYALIMIRTFAEHQADENENHRSVLVEKPRVLSWLFLNNNLHYVHHKFPRLAWYELPKIFAQHRDQLIAENGGYVFNSYKDQFLKYGLTCKEPVAHPLWNMDNRVESS